MPDELCVSKHVVLCFLLGGNQSYCVRHDQWWREDALQLRQQPDLEVDWSTANSWVFCGFFTISPVISQVISRGSFLARTFVETHQGLLFWKVKMWPPCRSLSWWTSIMACPLAILVITCFFSQICCEKKTARCFWCLSSFRHTLPHLHPSVGTHWTHWRCGTHACMGADERCLHVDHQEALISDCGTAAAGW